MESNGLNKCVLSPLHMVFPASGNRGPVAHIETAPQPLLHGFYACL